MKLIVPALALSVATLVFLPPAATKQPSQARALASACFTCHGTDGNSVQGVPPSLAGRKGDELYRTMKDFQAGMRPATIMHQQARGYTDAQLKLIASYFEAVRPAAAQVPARP